MDNVKCMTPWDYQGKRIYETNGVYPTLYAAVDSGQQTHGVCYAIDQQGGKSNCGYAEEVMMTLCSDSHGTPHALCYAIEGNGARPSHLGKGYSDDGAMYTLNTIEQHSVCYSIDCRNLNANKEVSGTLHARENGGFSYNFLNPILRENDKQ